MYFGLNAVEVVHSDPNILMSSTDLILPNFMFQVGSPPKT